MAILLRTDKGSKLTYIEADGNFSSLFYSASISGNTLSLYYTGSQFAPAINPVNIDIPQGSSYWTASLGGTLTRVSGVGITGNLQVVGQITGSVLKLASLSSGTTETKILVADGSGNVRYRTDLQLQGVQGIQGLIGLQGIQGIQGTIGLQGIQGLQGIEGLEGIQGIQGTQGTQGTQGVQGLQGTQGTQGIQGATGVGGVTSIIAGTNITISPTEGTGSVTINSSGGGASFPFTGSAQITGSLGVTGSLSVIGSITGSADAKINLVTVGRGGGNQGSNAAFGISAGISNTTGDNNTFVGSSAGTGNTVGSGNSFVGNGAGLNNTVGNRNTLNGTGTLMYNITGSYNTAVGCYAGRTGLGGAVTTISNQSVYIGSETQPLADNETNQIVIGHGAVGAGSNTVTIGNTNITSTILRGNVTATGFFNSSDSRLKEVIKRDGDVIYYKWLDRKDGKEHIGYIAQEQQQKYPDQIGVQGDFLTVNYIEILVAKVRELEKEVELLKSKV